MPERSAHTTCRPWQHVVVALATLSLVGPVPALAQAPQPIPTVPASSPGASLDQLRTTAQMRMRRDLETFTREQLREIEALYQSANRNLRAPESSERLQELVEKYPGSNRAGCAALYLAQRAAEGEREALLQQVVERHADAWYGDGTQVGPMAQALLAALYLKQERRDEAGAAARVVASAAPDAVDHQGRRIVDVLKGMGLVP